MLKKAPKDGPEKLRPDVAETAFRTMLEATGQVPKTVPREGDRNSEAARRGKLGGKARSKSQSAKARRQISKKAAAARWKRGQGGDGER